MLNTEHRYQGMRSLYNSSDNNNQHRPILDIKSKEKYTHMHTHRKQNIYTKPQAPQNKPARSSIYINNILFLFTFFSTFFPRKRYTSN